MDENEGIGKNFAQVGIGSLVDISALAEVTEIDYETGHWRVQGKMGNIEIVHDLGEWMAKSLQAKTCPHCHAPLE